MRGREVGLVAASALGASAFLIPAGIAPIEGDLSISVFNPKSQLVRLPCSVCVFSAKDREEKIENAGPADDAFWIQGGANDVILNFTVSEDQSLEVNGHLISPAEDTIEMLAPLVHLLQKPALFSWQQIEDGTIRSMTMTVTDVRPVPGAPFAWMEDKLSSLRYTILSPDSSSVNVDEVVVDLLKTGGGELLILDARVEPSLPKFMNEEASNTEAIPSFATGIIAGEEFEQTKCGSIPRPICRLVRLIEAKVAHFKSLAAGKKPGCGGRRLHQLPGHIKPGFLRGGPQPEWEVEGIQPPHHPFPGRHHQHKHHGHRHHHSFFHSMARGFVAVVIPTLIGVAVGMFISVVGLIVGRLVGFVWATLVRGNRHNGYDSVATEEAQLEDETDTDGKVALLDEKSQEAPPVYEDTPAYVEQKTTQ